MNGKILYLDCSSGISGDMTVAALLSAGADEEALRRALDSLALEGVEIVISRVKKGGIWAVDFDVVIDESVKREERNLGAVLSLLETADATERSKLIAKKIFVIAAAAQAQAHKTTVEHVYFHEKGAVDSIVDILSAAVCLDDLGIVSAVLSPIMDGSGEIEYRYGRLPVPVPAVRAIAESYGLPLRVTDYKGEMVTPTGAAIAAAIWNRKNLPEAARIVGIGYGSGKRQYKDADFSGLLTAKVLEEKIINSEYRN